MTGASVLGVDIGSSRIRIASIARRNDKSYLRAVVARDVPSEAVTYAEVNRPELVSGLIEEMLGELGTRERRCVCAIGVPAASLHLMRLAPMTSLERMQSARLEIERHIGRNLDDVVVRIHPTAHPPGYYGVGAVARRALSSRVSALRGAGLRVAAVDHEALALRRLFPDVDAFVDVGLQRTTCYSFSEADCAMSWTATGGAAITETIRRDLQLEAHVAEQRKRIVGIAGAGESAVADLVREVGALLAAPLRARSSSPAICIVGNGSRIVGFGDRLSRKMGVALRYAKPTIELDDRVQDEVARRAMPDWAVSIGLALWSGT